MKFIIAIIAAVVAMAMAQDQASGPQADADATNVRNKKEKINPNSEDADWVLKSVKLYLKSDSSRK